MQGVLSGGNGIYMLDIVIVNHAIALSGIILEKQQEDSIEEESASPAYSHTIFPGEAKYIVFDEAHHLETDATTAWQHEISKHQIQFFIEQLYGSRGNLNIFKPRGDEEASPLKDIYTSLKSNEDRLILMTKALFEELFPNLMRQFSGDKDSDLLIDDILDNSDEFRASFSTLRDLRQALVDVMRLLERGSDFILSQKLQKVIKIRIEHAKRIIKSLDCVVGGDKSYVRYLQRQRQSISVIAAPIRVAEHLNDYVYKNFSSVVMTSATLTINESFNFIASRLGLSLISKGKFFGARASSSFNYAKQVKFYVPEGIIYKNKQEEHFQKSVDFLKKAIMSSSGGSLILCSGHDQVDALYNKLRDTLAAQNILLLRQEKDRGVNSVVADFKDDINSVLIGTESLWEGIDVPGGALRSLFIFKIPFPPPRALTKARQRDVEDRGGNWYKDYSEPLATIALKQGFGRLIRKASDEGVVVLLDEGLIDKKTIVKSFPKGVVPQKSEIGNIFSSLESVAERIAEEEQQ